MKKIFYISLFTFLGVLTQQFIHGIVEIFYIKLLLENFEIFGLGLTWDAWFVVHIVGGTLLFILGSVLGLQQGFYWWKRIYEGH